MTAAVRVLTGHQGGQSASGGLVPAFTVHHELGMQHQIATGLLHLCSVAGATAQQPGKHSMPCLVRTADGRDPPAALPTQASGGLCPLGARRRSTSCVLHTLARPGAH